MNDVKIAISSESSCDLPKKMTQQYDVHILPYHIHIGDDEFVDGEISTEELFARAEKIKKLPKTSAINESEFVEYFTQLKRDYDAVVHIALSGELTSATDNAFRAAKEVGGVYVVDSRSLSTGVGLLVVYACELRDSGYGAAEIADMVRARTPYVQCGSVIETLDYLYRGGRCNALQRLGANLLKLRPRIIIKDGKIGTDKKYRGEIVRVLEKYGREILEDFPTPDLSHVFVVYTSATPEMIAAGVSACRKAGFVNIHVAQAGGTVATHCGPHTLGIMYINDGDRIAKTR